MTAYAGEVTSMHPHFSYSSPARAMDMDLETRNLYGGPNHITSNIQHGSWTVPVEKQGRAPGPSLLKHQGHLNSNTNQDFRPPLKYSKEDYSHIERWVQRHTETTWHSLGTCSMAPKEGNSIVKHGVLDERLNVHGVKNLKVSDLSICPDNVGCNTFSTALLIGEKCSVLAAEDLGYSGDALDMKIPTYQAPGEFAPLARL